MAMSDDEITRIARALALEISGERASQAMWRAKAAARGAVLSAMLTAIRSQSGCSDDLLADAWAVINLGGDVGNDDLAEIVGYARKYGAQVRL